MSPHVSLNRVRPGSPHGPLFKPMINSKYFVTPTSLSNLMTSESSPITHCSNKSPKIIPTSHRFNFNSPDSSFTMTTTQVATPKSSAFLSRNSESVRTSATDYQCSVDLDLESYSPPTDMDTDVSELLEQFAAIEDDSFTVIVI